MKISRIFVYPIKSCGGVELPETEVTPTGLKYDRQFVLVDSNGKFLSQRREPNMCLIEASLGENVLLVSHPAPSTVLVMPLYTEPEGPSVSVDIWGKPGYGIDMGNYASEWFSSYLGVHCRLLKYDFQQPRQRPPREPGTPAIPLSFADGFPILLISEESLADLNGRLTDPVAIERFRPNIVITGANEAFAEDRWEVVSFGGARFTGQKPCERCTVPTIDQATGISDPNEEPITTLKTYRGRPVLFGKNLSVKRAGQIHIGDNVIGT